MQRLLRTGHFLNAGYPFRDRIRPEDGQGIEKWITFAGPQRDVGRLPRRVFVDPSALPRLSRQTLHAQLDEQRRSSINDVSEADRQQSAQGLVRRAHVANT
jgi:hypothetical protein